MKITTKALRLSSSYKRASYFEFAVKMGQFVTLSSFYSSTQGAASVYAVYVHGEDAPKEISREEYIAYVETYLEMLKK